MKSEDYCDLMYGGDRAKVSHLVPFGENRALCGKYSDSTLRDDWYGTGDMHEYDKAVSLPLCFECEERSS